VSQTFTLTEYRPEALPVDNMDARWLAILEPRRFEVWPETGSDRWIVSPGSTVGVLELPSGSRLRCQPKAPVRNVFYMLATAYGFRDPFLDQALAFERIDELFDFLVEHLANLIDARLERGLYRAYVERQDNLPAVRGRILIAEDVRRNAVLRHRTFCQYTEFTWDIPENRVIRQTVFAMSRLVRSPVLQQRLAALDRALGEIDPAPLPLSRFDTFHYHRLNDDYRPIHRLCRLLLEGASVSEQTGDLGFRAFLLDMNQLYETFLSVALRDALGDGLELTSQRVRHLDRDNRVTIRPDLAVLAGGIPCVIADAKYKLTSGPGQGHADLYQMLAYCTAEQVHRGVLIYPRWEGAGASTVRVRNSPVEIERFSIDLGGSIADIQTEVRRLASRLRFLAGTSAHALPNKLLTLR
jgi:5-methylcytosine-specific restriction enzyme subunit McrC